MKKLKSTAILLLAAVIWGVSFVAQRVGAEHVGSFTFNGVRFALGSLSLVPVILLFERGKTPADVRKKTLYYGAVAGVILFCASNLQQFGVELTQSAGKSAFITGLYTVLVPVVYMFFGKKTGVNIWISAGFAVVGLYLLCGASGPIGWGDLCLFISAFLLAIHIIFIDRAASQVRLIRFSCIQFAVCAVLGLICALIFEDISLCALRSAAFPILYGGIMSSGVACTCQVIGQRDADPTAAAIVLSTESLWAAVGGLVILQEKMSAPAYIGCALMLCGIIVSQVKLGRRKNGAQKG